MAPELEADKPFVVWSCAVFFGFYAGSTRTSMTAPVRVGSPWILALSSCSVNRGIVMRPLLSILA